MTETPTSADGKAEPFGRCVAICTRSRPDSFAAALKSVLETVPSGTSVIVTDQSRDDATEQITRELAVSYPQIRYIRLLSRGLSRSRNAAIAAAADCDVLVFTDDDCVVRKGWFEAMVSPFQDPRVGLVFGNVVPIPVPESEGFIVGYKVAARRVLRGRLGKLRDGGIGASMAVRIAASQQIGNFDEMLGAGGHFASCEDGDFTYRILKAGFSVAHEPNAVVDHGGVRDWASGPALVLSTYHAVGAAYAKHLRCGDPVGALLLGQQVLLCGWEVTRNAARFRRPLGLRRISSLARGAYAGWRAPVDKRRGLFEQIPERS